jgi:hypothetical protein
MIQIHHDPLLRLLHSWLQLSREEPVNRRQICNGTECLNVLQNVDEDEKNVQLVDESAKGRQDVFAVRDDDSRERCFEERGGRHAGDVQRVDDKMGVR